MRHCHSTISVSGQSLVESVVAIAVVMLLLMGLVIATTTTISTTTNSQMRTAALKYAQNGLEIVRMRRDASWNQFVDDFGTSPTKCVTGTTLQDSGCALEDRVFTRTLQFTYVTVPAEEMVVRSTVSWQERGNTRSVDLQTTLTPWK